ncbi:MAG: hypothetical protein EB078_05390 [Proteobacteria bacterium]|nr:hypothetical protein [Pseudomonadota bacterium]NDC25923.1 hypothetical protein [Pseudomonadota bacterium]NDD04318.1 hypothetical protein [Pseudomonadota bacterium]NDG26085.1 hypothetical protein [Pseudomonadota bacterium]
MKTFWWSLSGAVVCVTLITWLGPTLISWWFTPPVDTLFNCKGPIEWSLRRFQWAQFAGLMLGAVAGAIVRLAFKRHSPSQTPY